MIGHPNALAGSRLTHQGLSLRSDASLDEAGLRPNDTIWLFQTALVGGVSICDRSDVKIAIQEDSELLDQGDIKIEMQERTRLLESPPRDKISNSTKEDPHEVPTEADIKKFKQKNRK